MSNLKNVMNEECVYVLFDLRKSVVLLAEYSDRFRELLAEFSVRFSALKHKIKLDMSPTLKFHSS